MDMDCMDTDDTTKSNPLEQPGTSVSPAEPHLAPAPATSASAAQACDSAPATPAAQARHNLASPEGCKPHLTWGSFWGHLRTITRHKMLVMHYCFKVGLYKQGLLHDLSKYSPTEFWVGARYYQGFRSPNAAERVDRGISEAWLHHKGRNKHHSEYWIDIKCNGDTSFEGKPMPTRYVVEMFCDRIAASRVYKKDLYTDRSPLEYFEMEHSGGPVMIHPDTDALLKRMLDLLAERGEDEALRIVRETIVKPRYAAGECARF